MTKRGVAISVAMMGVGLENANWVCLGVGGAFILVATGAAMKTWWRLSRWQQTRGTIVGQERIDSEDIVYRAVVEYQDDRGLSRQFTNQIGRYSPCKIGEEVWALYNPAQPTVGMICFFKSLRLFPLIVFTIGMLVLIAGFI